MIFNRTADDVRNARVIRKTKIEKGLPITEQEAEILERGFITLKTLNRIEGKQEEIKQLINDIGYYNAPNSNMTWTSSDEFVRSDLERIVDNNKALGNAFFVLNQNLLYATARYHYSDINTLERLLYELEQTIEEFEIYFRECGAFYCGEDTEVDFDEKLWNYDSETGDLYIDPLYCNFDEEVRNLQIYLPTVNFDETTGELIIGE